MLGRAKAQGSLLEARVFDAHLLTRGSVYERLAEHGHEIISDDDFAHCYSPSTGRPSIPPSMMMRAVLLATHDKCSDAEASRRTRVDLDWKAALGVDRDFRGIAATTFSLFRARLVLHDAERAVLEATVAKAVAAGVLKGKVTAIIDSSPVTGAGAVADTYRLVRKTMGRLARAAGDAIDADLAARVEALAAVKADINWHDPAVRKAHLGELVAAAQALLEAVDIDDATVAEAAGLLAAIVDQDVVRDRDGRPEIRRGVATDRVVSHSDPQMRHGRKSASRRFDGHKLDVVSDEHSELVLDIDVRAGNAADGDAAAPAVQRINDMFTAITEDSEADEEETGLRVATLVGDMAYSDGDVREAVEAAGAALVAKVPPTSNSGRFPKTDFVLDLDADTPAATCPADVTTTTTVKTNDHKGRRTFAFAFPAATCAACPLRQQCVKGNRGRKVTVSVHKRRIAAARTAQTEDADTVALLRARAKVERKIDHLQDLGMRHARYRGRRKTRLQAVLAAIVANVNRLDVLGAFDTASSAPLMAQAA
ncbi:IS1182-like element ISGvi6 family transposase [soil metagenome]